MIKINLSFQPCSFSIPMITFEHFKLNLKQDELNDIIKACIANKSVAQERLYKHYFALMFSICKSYTYERQDTISLVNEGFLKIFLNLKSFDALKGNFEGWAKKIVTNNCIDYARSQKGKIVHIPIEVELTVPIINNNKDKYIEDELLSMLEKLPVTTKKVFSLHVLDGFSHKDISRELNIAESTSRWHVMEARKVLKKDVQKIV